MNITIIEDDIMLASSISQKIIRSGYNTNIFNSIGDFKNNSLFTSNLYIIDVGLPDGTGLDIVQYLRIIKKISVPILIMSCLGSVRDKVLGLDFGADDYIIKPFSPDEFIARIRALLRRSLKINNSPKLYHDNIIFNLINKQITLKGKIIHLPNKEKLILKFFLLNKGEIIIKNRLIDIVWHNDFASVSDNTINATLSKLRKKLGNSFLLETHVNQGYILK